MLFRPIREIPISDDGRGADSETESAAVQRACASVWGHSAPTSALQEAVMDYLLFGGAPRAKRSLFPPGVPADVATRGRIPEGMALALRARVVAEIPVPQDETELAELVAQMVQAVEADLGQCQPPAERRRESMHRTKGIQRRSVQHMCGTRVAPVERMGMPPPVAPRCVRSGRLHALNNPVAPHIVYGAGAPPTKRMKAEVLESLPWSRQARV